MQEMSFTKAAAAASICDGPRTARSTGFPPGTRSWAEAELKKRELEDQLAGRITESNHGARLLADAIEIFKADKKNQGITADVLGRYNRELERLEGFAAGRRVFTVPRTHAGIAH